MRNELLSNSGVQRPAVPALPLDEPAQGRGLGLVG